jgi:GNAT superfamily N-acetyltransferase
VSCEVITGPLGAGDLARLAELHGMCLPRSILSALGPAAVARYYAYAAGSRDETIVVGRIDGIVEAGLVVSHAPATLLRRFALHAPGTLGGELARRLITSGELRRRCWSRLRERPGAELELPEVVQIFTAPAHRGRGIGSQLLRSCEETLARASNSAYCIHTHADDNVAGLRFYRREGFAVVGEARSFGDRFVVMKKGPG